MAQNLQQKYDQLQRLCKRQQTEITRLQNEIRERCQSYLLHSSKYKRSQINQNEATGNLEITSQSSSRIRKESDQSGSSQADKSEPKVQQKPIKVYNLSLRKEIQFLIEPSIEIANARISQMAALTQSFKARITTLQNNKNEYVKELEKANREIKELRHRNTNIERQMEIISKSERKMKEKLKKIPQYEHRIDDMYIRLMREVRKEEICEDGYEQKHMNDKLQEIIDWISTSKSKIDNLLEQITKVEPKENQEVLVEKPEEQPQQQPKKQSEKLNQQIELVQPYEQSPSKSQRKLPGQSYTIISKLNEIDIKPFQGSEVKPYNMTNEVETKNQEQQNLINTLEQNSLIFQEELKQSQNEISHLKSQIARNRNKSSQLQEELMNNMTQNSRIKDDMEKEIIQLRKELEESRVKNSQMQQQLQEVRNLCKRYYEQQKGQEKLEEQLNNTKQELSNVKKSNSEIIDQLEKSRIKLSQLVQSKMTNEIQTLSSSLQKEQFYNSQAASNSKLTVTQQLEAPYFVEEDLENNSNNEYVKRSFIRKKIVKRNLSATAYRIVSKSKEEVQQIMSSKIKQYHDRSKEKAAKFKEGEKLSKQAKLSALQNCVNRVSQVSEPRDSDINREEEVRIIEVTTKTPFQQIKTAKIYSKGGQSNLSTRRKY